MMRPFLRKLVGLGLNQVTLYSLAGALLVTVGVASCGEQYGANTSYTLVRPIEDVDYGRVQRARARIQIPLGRTKQQVRSTLKRAAEEIADRNGLDAVMVFGYRPEDEPTGHYTVGRAVLAPNGTWGDTDSPGPTEIKVTLGSLYFDPPTVRVSAGDTVVLRTDSGDSVNISKAYDDWRVKMIIMRVPNGTKAVVLERRAEPTTADQMFVRYRVKPIGGEEDMEGWVHPWHADRPDVSGERVSP